MTESSAREDGLLVTNATKEMACRWIRQGCLISLVAPQAGHTCVPVLLLSSCSKYGLSSTTMDLITSGSCPTLGPGPPSRPVPRPFPPPASALPCRPEALTHVWFQTSWSLTQRSIRSSSSRRPPSTPAGHGPPAQQDRRQGRRRGCSVAAVCIVPQPHPPSAPTAPTAPAHAAAAAAAGLTTSTIWACPRPPRPRLPAAAAAGGLGKPGAGDFLDDSEAARARALQVTAAHKKHPGVVC